MKSFLRFMPGIDLTEISKLTGDIWRTAKSNVDVISVNETFNDLCWTRGAIDSVEQGANCSNSSELRLQLISTVHFLFYPLSFHSVFEV